MQFVQKVQERIREYGLDAPTWDNNIETRPAELSVLHDDINMVLYNRFFVAEK